MNLANEVVCNGVAVELRKEYTPKELVDDFWDELEK